ncbi:MAG: ATP-binding protein, partial [Bacteriovoracales bacterium]|nr:ATP-binding protein [Bacteriovoracales bacterium]
APVNQAKFTPHRERFLRELNSLDSALDRAELSPKRLSRNKWFELLYRHFNGTRPVAVPVIKDEYGPFAPSLVSQLILTDIFSDRKAVQVGNLYFRCITLHTLPEGITHAAMVENLLKMPFHYHLSQSIEVLGPKELQKLQLLRRITSAMAHGASHVADLENESKLSALEEIIGQVMDGREKIVRMDFKIIIWGKNPAELDDKSDEVLKAYRDMGQAEGLIETYGNLDAFVSAMPGSCEFFRDKKLKTSNCAHFMPVYSYWKGNTHPVCLLPNREGGLCSIDPFDKTLPNYNALIFGGSGSGKSFAILQLMMMFSSQTPPPKVIWIDNGASSKKLLEALDGQFIDLNLESGLCLNPFDGKPTPSKIKLLLATIEIMLKDGRSLPKLHKSLLEEAIYKTYEKENPTLSCFREILSTHKELADYARILYTWTGKRPFGRLLDGKSNIDLSKHLITIEIKGLDDYPDLQQVMLLNLTDFIKATAATIGKTLLIIDEAWRLFSGAGQDFAIEAYRTFRKYGAGIWCISQNYRDFLSDKGLADTLLPNTASVFVLPQKGIDWQDLQRKLQLNDSELGAIKELKTKKGKYSELFLSQEENRNILKIIPDALAYWIATSDPGDNAKLMGRWDNAQFSKTIMMRRVRPMQRL